MADVTISQLTPGVPTGNNILPYSTGSNTLSVPVSAILQNAGNVGIGTTTPNAKLDVNGDINSTNTPKAYGIFNGSNAINTNCTILKSYNISKIEKMSDIGAYKVTFNTSVNWPYVPMVTGFNNGSGDGGWVAVGHGNGGYYYAIDPTSTEFYLLGYTYTGSWQSQKYISFVVF